MARFSLLQPDVAKTWKNAVTCRAHFAYFNRSHFSQPRYRCRAKGCRQESAGVWKVFQRLEVLVECHHFIAASTLGSPVVEFSNRKILFSYLEASYEIYETCTIRKFPTMWYNYVYYVYTRNILMHAKECMTEEWYRRGTLPTCGIMVPYPCTQSVKW